MKKYKLKNNNSLLFDIKGVRFHIKSSDYFGTLASVLNILKEKIEKIEKTEEKELMIIILKNTIKDCLYLQKNYSIIAKNKNKKTSK